jgi:Arc/MetJ-type ribon-helix-helix transcriptional regulator
MPVGGTTNLRPDLAGEIRQEIEAGSTVITATTLDGAREFVEASEAVRVAVRRVTEAQAGATALREEAETAHAALDRITGALGEDPEQVTGSSVPSLVEDTLGTASAELADLKARIDRALSLHREFKIYDECDHDHRYNEDGTLPEGVLDIDEIGLTCQDAYLYSICSNCCTGGSEEWQTEACANDHKHDGASPCWPCPTRAALASGVPETPEPGEESRQRRD